ncbi:hypothetical protein JCGZ_02450 [Jatropha curcas]|uniref:Uncharacterized protein n=1 Tax=Jatropha curcas TaxID=180498 RepID=A0A067L586_JATCU|nr:uncharacterized protein LOC105629775 [Jatropha curcas]KDP42393.1 hypothetical protein JCGZ_02450 [Jatropha curcas]
MANSKLLVLPLLILYGIIAASVRAEACPLYCLDVEYMTCESSGEEKLSPRCNCCLAPKNCTLHLSDGTSIFCKPN